MPTSPPTSRLIRFPLADASLAERLGQYGDSAVAMIELEINRQALMIAYIDDFHAMMLVTLAAMPLVWLLRKARQLGTCPQARPRLTFADTSA